MYVFKNKTGETVFEVLITVLIILIAFTASFRILMTSLAHKNLTKNRIVAINLAREGLEAVRYIRDYNWLFYGSKKRVCWNHLQDNNNNGALGDDAECLEFIDTNCTDSNCGFAANQIGSGDSANPGNMEYILKQNGTHWFLTRCYKKNSTDCASTTLITNGSWDTATTADKIAVKITDTTRTNSPDSTDITKGFQLCKGDSAPKNNMITSCLNTEVTTNQFTKFFRYVKIFYEGNINSVTTSATLSEGQQLNKMKVLVGVKWLENGVEQDIELVTMLSDFYERTTIDGQN